MSTRTEDPLLKADESALIVGLSLPGFWKGVSTGRLPAPLYPASRAPRWRKSELEAALEATRMKPCDAKAARRIAKIEAARSAA